MENNEIKKELREIASHLLRLGMDSSNDGFKQGIKVSSKLIIELLQAIEENEQS